MKTTALLPLVLALAACTYGPGYPPPGPYPGPYPGPPVDQGSYKAIGTEPFWDLTIGRDMVFTDRGNDVGPVVQPTPRPISGIAGEIYQSPRINVNIVHAQCSDGMSDRTYPDKVQVRVDGRQYEGCGGPAAFWANRPGEGPGYPGPGGDAVMLSGTNWRVVAINGRPTPPANFYVNFMPDRLAAKFGCNGLGGSYTQAGNTLSAGPIMGTRMACPDMSFETEGSRVLSRPMTVSGVGDRITFTNTNGSIDLIRND